MLSKLLLAGIASMVDAKTTCFNNGGAMECSNIPAVVKNSANLMDLKDKMGNDLGNYWPMNEKLVGSW